MDYCHGALSDGDDVCDGHSVVYRLVAYIHITFMLCKIIYRIVGVFQYLQRYCL
jgi:hypothetical protein